MCHNKKGFTLIEIIVSIALVSVILMLAGTLILTSSNLLSTSSERDIDKRTVDSIIDFVRGEIEYATDVRIVEPGSKYVPDYANDNNWHYFYIKNDRLYRDDVDLFDDGFYSNRDFNMTVKANYENSTRVDIRYVLNDGNEDTYSSRDTIMLLNLSVSDEIRKDGLYPSEYQAITENGYRIYYNKKYTAPSGGPNTPDIGKPGTVADIQDNISGDNYRGVYTNSGYRYQLGEIVWHNGYWWECVVNQISNVPGESFMWKCLDSNYAFKNTDYQTNNSKIQLNSAYEKNDIVVYEDNYYQVTSNTLLNNSADVNIKAAHNWKKIGPVGDLETEKIVKENKYSQRSVYNNQNVVKKYFPNYISMKDPLKIGAENYVIGKTYKNGDIVKIPSDSSKTFYNLYIKVMEGNGGFTQPGENATSGWLKIDVSYSKTSSYLKDDIVIIDESVQLWVKAKTNIVYTMDIRPDTNNMYWTKL